MTVEILGYAQHLFDLKNLSQPRHTFGLFGNFEKKN